jgi:hypothetical protein
LAITPKATAVPRPEESGVQQLICLILQSFLVPSGAKIDAFVAHKRGPESVRRAPRRSNVTNMTAAGCCGGVLWQSGLIYILDVSKLPDGDRI